MFLLGSFLFGDTISEEEVMGEKNSLAEVLYQSHTEESVAKSEADEEEKHFSMLMESLGANNVFEEWVHDECIRPSLYLCTHLSISYIVFLEKGCNFRLRL